MNDDQLSRLLRRAEEPASPDPMFADRLFEQLAREAARSGGFRPGLLLIAAAMLVASLAVGLAVGAGLLKLPWLVRNVTPAPSVLAVSTQEATPSAAPTGSPAPTPVAIDRLVKSTVDGLTVRDHPTTSGVPLGTIDTGQLGFVVAGPVNADGYSWYQLSAVGLPPNAGCEPPVQTNPFRCPDWLGWVAGGQPGGQAWLESTTLPCPASPMNLDSLVGNGSQGPQTALERLACYGSSPIRFRAWWPQIPPDAGLGGTCGDLQHPTNPTWLICQNINYNGLVISESEGFGGVGLKISIGPDSVVTMPARGQWVEVVAHLDDPAARDCAPIGGGEQDPVRVTLTCRAELVADSVMPVSGPY